MARNASGTYSLPAKNPVVTGTTIESDWANTTLADIAAALTDSLSRNGNGGMLVPLKMLDGTVGAPGITFTNEPTSGFYRAAAGDVRLSILGVDALTATASGLVAAGTFEAEGGLVITRPELPAVGQQVSAGASGSTNDTVNWYSVPNLAVTITTTGRPVIVGLMPDPAVAAGSFGCGLFPVQPYPSETTTIMMYFRFARDGASLGHSSIRIADNDTTATYVLPPPAPIVDPVGAGTYTYTFDLLSTGSVASSVRSVKLYAYEL